MSRLKRSPRGGGRLRFRNEPITGEHPGRAVYWRHQNYPGREPEGYDILARSQPIGRMAQAHEIASLALLLCSEEASFITGCDCPIDGGFVNLR